MTSVVLIQPKVGLWDNILSKSSIPLSLLRVSTFAHKNHDIKIIDQRLNKKWQNALKKELKKGPLCVGITAMSGSSIKYGIEVSEIVKNESPNTTMVWGGTHPTIIPSITLKHKYVDVVLRGEGEKSFSELLEHLERNKSLKEVKGISYKEKGKQIHNPPNKLLDLNKLPDLPYHLVDIKDYLPKHLGRKTINMETSRGCPNQCKFCYNSLGFGGIWRTLTTENVLKQVKRVIDNFGVEHIFFVDDNLFLSHKRIFNICKGLIKEKLDLTWDTQGACISDIYKMSMAEIRLMEKSGCNRLMLGVQSGSQKILDMLNLNVTPQQAITVNKKLKSYNIIPHYYFIVGFPYESKEDRLKTINLALRLLKENKKATTSPFFCYEPWPGTPLFEKASKDYDLQMPKDMEYWIESEWDSSRAPWLTDEEKGIVESLHFASVFYDKKSEWYSDSRLIKFLVSLYRPIARHRIRKLNFNFMIERLIGDKIVSHFSN